MTGATTVLAPATREELASLVEAAARDRAPLFVTGGPQAPGGIPGAARVLSTRGLARVVAHEPGDLTLTAEGGLTLAAAQALLEPHRQFLAFDPPDPARATLGGLIASGRDGPMATRFGAIRDQVLGLAVVNGDGRLTRSGGRVVKNVTGYDLCRLYAGSAGGLGVVVEATVRVRPLPEACRRLDFRLANEADAFARAWELRAAVPEIASIQISGGVEGPFVLTAIVAGLDAFVQAASLEITGILGPADVRAWDPRSFRVAGPPDGLRGIAIGALPTSWPALSRDVAPLLSPPLGFAHDVVRGLRESWHASARPPFLDEKRLDEVLAKAGATLDCPGDPTFLGSLLERFPGQAPGGLSLMRGLKRALDPAGILNPGGTIYG
jgi:FAD/FMN-containing dehydrogenase